ncbi:MAG: ATP-binding protein, partial [Rhizobacter sp.]|nr:ATP-binding protein [Rhizobacter sp.]
DAVFTDRDKTELAKDVSGMANSLGGLIVYGIATDPVDKTLPRRISPIEKRNVETLDRVINSQVRPPIAGMRKRLIPEVEPQVLLLAVPESEDPPHQSLYDKRYYRRSGVECLPMEHDLVALKFGRKLSPLLDLAVHPLDGPSEYQSDLPWTVPVGVRVIVKNVGRRVGRDVLTMLVFPPVEVVRIHGSAHNMANLDDLSEGSQVRQVISAIAHHPSASVLVAELKLSFSRAAATRLSREPLIEWTVYADEMSPRTGTVSLATLGWVLPE